METEKNYSNCRHFDPPSPTCPHKDDPNLKAVRDWHQKEGITDYLGNEIDEANKLCIECEKFEPMSG